MLHRVPFKFLFVFLLSLLRVLPSQGQAATWQWGLQSTNPAATDGSPAQGQAVATDGAGRVYVGGRISDLASSSLASRSFGLAGTVGPGRAGFIAQASAAGQWNWVVPVLAAGATSSGVVSAEVTGIAVTAAGDCYATGLVYGDSLRVGHLAEPVGYPGTGFFIARLTSAGVCQQLRIIRGIFTTATLAADPSTGGLVVAGYYAGQPTIGSFKLPDGGAQAASGVALFVARLSAAGQWLSTTTAAGTGTLQTAVFLAVGASGQVAIGTTQTTGTFGFEVTTLTVAGGFSLAYVVAQLSAANQWQWALGGSSSTHSEATGVAYTATGALWVSGYGRRGALVGPLTLQGPASTNLNAFVGFVGQVTAAGQWGTVQQLAPSAEGQAMFGPLTTDAEGNALVLGRLAGFKGSVQASFGKQLLVTPAADWLVFVGSLTPAGGWRYVATVPSATLREGFYPQAIALDQTGALTVTGGLRGALMLGNSQLAGSYNQAAPQPAWGDVVLGHLRGALLLPTRPVRAEQPATLFPNPVLAGQGATFAYHLPLATSVRLLVLDALGRRVAVLAAGYQQAGRHAYAIPTLPAGVYQLHLQYAAVVESHLLVVQ